MSINKSFKKDRARKRSKFRIRKRILQSSERPRLSVFRSSKYTYAQVVSSEEEKTLVSCSTKDAEVIKAISEISRDGIQSSAESTKSVIAAKALGLVLGKKAKEKQIDEIVFDRNGYLYHGRIKAVADGAREAGLKF